MQELPRDIACWVRQQAGMRRTLLLNHNVCLLPQLTLKEGLTVYREQVRQLAAVDGQLMDSVFAAERRPSALCRASNSCRTSRHSPPLPGVCGQHPVQVRTLRACGGGLRPAGGAAGRGQRAAGPPAAGEEAAQYNAQRYACLPVSRPGAPLFRGI